MNGTLVAIETITVGSGGAASFAFNTIPTTYKDLMIVVSGRSNRSNTEDYLKVSFNSDTTDGNYPGILHYGTGSGVGGETFSAAGAPRFIGNTVGATATSGVFSNVQIYLADYRSSIKKTFLVTSALENNATAAPNQMASGVWNNTAAITSISLSTAFGSLVQHSTATLYGVAPTTTQIKATGGMVYEDTTYIYHAFTSSGTFTPTDALTCDVLVLAGGGGTANGPSGGGGAGQALLYSAQSLSATNYTVTIGGGGSGGAASTGGNAGSIGAASQFGALTSATPGNPGSENSGGTSGNSNAGGSAVIGTWYLQPGGGGLGAVGGSGSNGDAGVGGAGINTYASWLTVTNTGVNGYIGGGGGGGAAGWSNGSYQPSYGGIGGTGGGGGGGRTGYNDENQMPGGDAVVNTGSGGGGGGYWFQAGVANRKGKGGNGGSGLVIVRYAK